jgi:hypothetical protein
VDWLWEEMNSPRAVRDLQVERWRQVLPCPSSSEVTPHTANSIVHDSYQIK